MRSERIDDTQRVCKRNSRIWALETDVEDREVGERERRRVDESTGRGQRPSQFDARVGDDAGVAELTFRRTSLPD